MSAILEPTDEPTIESASPPAEPPVAKGESAGWLVLGLVIVLALAGATRLLQVNVPKWIDTSWVTSIDFPVYAIAVGLIGSVIITALGIRSKISGAFRTEFFIKTGLVLLGVSINIKIIVTAAGPAIVQALILVSAVFFFTWWLASVLGVSQKLRALLSTAVSICGVSAAIAAAGAVRATREQIAYTATLVVAFALPSIFILPWLADQFGLSDAVAGAWIGGNIDTTAAVAAAGTIAGEQAFQVATIVKLTQNVLIGFVAVALTLYFALRVERSANAAEARSGVGRQLWQRFPKFVLAFIIASAVGTWYVSQLGADDVNYVTSVLNPLREYFLILAFVSIGLEFRLNKLRQEGWKPVVVFGSAAVFNLVAGLALASWLFSDFAL